MANDHYISRFLTKPWEVQGQGNRDFWVFNFKTQKFRREPSRTLFAKEDMNTRELENLYSDLIETPVGKLRFQLPDRIMAAGGGPIDLSWPEQRGILLLGVLTGQRIRIARKSLPPDPMITAANLEQLAALADKEFTFFSYQMPSQTHLFFPDVSIIPLPLAGSNPALVIPLSTQFSFVFVEKNAFASQQQLLTKWLPKMHFFSVGVGRNVNDILMPPIYHEAAARQEEGLKTYILEARSYSRQMFDATGMASSESGLDAHSWD